MTKKILVSFSLAGAMLLTACGHRELQMCIRDREGQAILSSPEYHEFFEQSQSWLMPYAAYSYLREKYRTSDFTKWDKNAIYNKSQIRELCSEDSGAYPEISFYYFLQYILHTQFKSVSDYARKNGIVLKGDLPIGVNRTSIDAWTEPQYFNMNGQAGAPPDDFSVNGPVSYTHLDVYKRQIRKNTTNDFLNFYQNIDVLLLDDIQELIGMDKTQNTFFHIFNHLHQLGKQLILTSDKAPVDLQGMEERLITRLKWGLTAELSRPDLDLRKKILKNKINHDGIVIPDEVFNFIANNVTENVRDLEGILVSLMANAVINNKEIDLPLTKRVVSQAVRLEKKQLSVQMIQEIVCNYFNPVSYTHLRPNVIVFLVDDMGLMDTSLPFLTDEAGNPVRYPLNDWYQTPNMERMARQGIRFSTFYADVYKRQPLNCFNRLCA